jgi:hypothetical protein
VKGLGQAIHAAIQENIVQADLQHAILMGLKFARIAGNGPIPRPAGTQARMTARSMQGVIHLASGIACSEILWAIALT